MVNFADALDTRASDIEKPPLQPQGTYVWTVTKVPTISTTKNGEWDIIEFPIRAVSAEDDVDPEEVEMFGDLKSAMNRVNFMAPTAHDKEADRKKTLHRLKMFLIRTLRAGDEEMTLKELMAAAVGCQFLGSAVWRIDGEDTYVDVKNMAPLD